MAESCNICIEKYNKSYRARVVCKCTFEACRSCIKRYILDNTEDTHCLSCKTGWDRDFLIDNFEKTFINKTLKDHRENILIEREIGMLAATQPYVEKQINLEKLTAKRDEVKNTFLKQMAIIRKEIDEIQNNTGVERKKFIRKCPNENCLGFLSSSLKCDLCEHFSCSKCREVTGITTNERETHICNPQTVKSIEMITNDSKPCPKCTCLTFKVDGCNSMWCIECHTSWNWVSGRIENGVIHNPEYFDWLRKQRGVIPRNELDIQCGREIDDNFILQLTRHLIRTKLPNRNIFLNITREVIHIKYEELPRFITPDRLENNLELRIDYMRNKINKVNFGKKIQKKEKENQKKKEISNVINMYITCITDILYRLKSDLKNKEFDTMSKTNIDFLDEMLSLKQYTNEVFKRISSTYNCKIYSLDKDFKFK